MPLAFHVSVIGLVVIALASLSLAKLEIAIVYLYRSFAVAICT